MLDGETWAAPEGYDQALVRERIRVRGTTESEIG